MSVELKYSEECTDKDTPTLCIPSLRRGTSLNDPVRETAAERPAPRPALSILSIPTVANTNGEVAGERDIVKEVHPRQEMTTYNKESKRRSKHKVYSMKRYDEVAIFV